MRIVFLGTPDFAAHSLQRLHESGKEIVGVITSPDKKAGRGQQLKASAVKEYAIKNGLTCLQPPNLKDPNFIAELKALNADLQIVVAFRMLPEIVWNMPPLGTMNLHASLLPYYRGAAPINWAIINGEKKSGVTTFFLQHEIDTGEILLQQEVEIEKNESAGSLHDKLMITGANLLVQSVHQIEKGDFKTISQLELIGNGKNLKDLPNAPKIFREDCHINWNSKTEQVDCFIRGLSPSPSAWTQLKRKSDGKMVNLKIYKAALTETSSNYPPSTIGSEKVNFFVNCTDGVLEILELQLEGKKRMNSSDFLNGVNLDDYESCLF